jgi:hypothetical protein
MSRVERDPERGRAAADKLKALGVRGILIKAAELGYITQVACKMPDCFCPEELGGACYFEPVSPELSDWMPTHEHFPLSKRNGGKVAVDNAKLAHRLCNRIDYSITVGRPYAKDLERVRRARDLAIRRNEPGGDIASVAPCRGAATPGVSARTSTRRKSEKGSWRELPAREMAAHLLATPTINDRVWTEEARLPRESREAFIRRVLLGEVGMQQTREHDAADPTDPR